MIVLGLAFAALIGLSLGLLGGGGSILTVPIFVYVLDVEPKRAIAMSLPVVGITSAVAAVRHWRAGSLALRVALTFGLVTMGGSFLGAYLSHFVSGATQLAMLGIVMLVAATFMFRRPPVSRTDSVADASGSTDPSAAVHEPGAAGGEWSVPVIALAAVGVGLLTGLVGIGGGFLIVPALVLFVGMPMKRAIGTSLLVITMSCAAALVRYASSVPIDWSFVAMFSAVAVGGAFVGTHVVRYVPQTALRRAFAVFLVLMAAFILVQNRHVFRARPVARVAM